MSMQMYGTPLINWGFMEAEITRADVTYEELAEKLKAHGMNENAASIANKISRGTFAATFFLACLAALELEGIRLEDIIDFYNHKIAQNPNFKVKLLHFFGSLLAA